MLQKRKTEKISVTYHPSADERTSLKRDAKEFFQLVKGKAVVSIRLTAGATHGYRDVLFDSERLVRIEAFSTQLKASLGQFALKKPLSILVTDAVPSDMLAALEPFSCASDQAFRIVSSSSTVQNVGRIEGGVALVCLGLVESLHAPRKTSEILRSVIPDGRVDYVALATVVESPEVFRQLAVALKTGATGPNAFGFAPGKVLIMRNRSALQSPWEREREWLSQIVEEDELADLSTPEQIVQRLEFLRANGVAQEMLFWHDQNGHELKLQKDFVFLPVDGKESQADVYAIVTNLISTAIQLNREPKEPVSAEELRRALRQTVYVEAVLDPNNFMKFNDAILRAAMLRAAESAELNYSRDLELSSTIASLVIHEISEWKFGRGQVLAEFLVALGTGHLRLCPQHHDDVKEAIRAEEGLPAYLKRLIT